MILIIGIMLAVLVIFLCVITVPIISLLIHNRNVKKETIYEFSKELFEYDYPDIELFEKEKEKFERRKQQILSKDLPWII